MNTPTLPVSFDLSVNCDQTLQAMIEACRCGEVGEHITAERFPVTSESADYEARHFVFDDHLISPSLADNLIRLDDTDNPWVSARIEHVLAFGAANLEDSMSFLVVALGSRAAIGKRQYERMPCLGLEKGKRALALGWWNSLLPPGVRFLAVRPRSSRVLVARG